MKDCDRGRVAFFISVFHSLLQWQSVSGVSPCTHSQMDNITNGHISILKQKWYTNHTSSFLWFRFRLLQLNGHKRQNWASYSSYIQGQLYYCQSTRKKIALLHCIFCQKYARIILTSKYIFRIYINTHTQSMHVCTEMHLHKNDRHVHKRVDGIKKENKDISFNKPIRGKGGSQSQTWKHYKL